MSDPRQMLSSITALTWGWEQQSPYAVLFSLLVSPPFILMKPHQIAPTKWGKGEGDIDFQACLGKKLNKKNPQSFIHAEVFQA